MVEVVIASMLTAMMLLLLVNTQIQVLRNFQRAIDENTANMTTYNALRTVREQAQEAVQGLVLAGGSEVWLFPPQRDATGNLILPVQPDRDRPVIFRVDFHAGSLTQTQSGTATTLLTGVRSVRPGDGSYVPFSIQQYAPGVQALQVRLSVQQGQNPIWFEEMILLRNAFNLGEGDHEATHATER
ncbi:MAG: hypothetical protein C4337_06550 [Armatimonadota bacterium]